MHYIYRRHIWLPQILILVSDLETTWKQEATCKLYETYKHKIKPISQCVNNRWSCLWGLYSYVYSLLLNFEVWHLTYINVNEQTVHLEYYLKDLLSLCRLYSSWNYIVKIILKLGIHVSTYQNPHMVITIVQNNWSDHFAFF